MSTFGRSSYLVNQYFPNDQWMDYKIIQGQKIYTEYKICQFVKSTKFSLICLSDGTLQLTL